MLISQRIRQVGEKFQQFSMFHEGTFHMRDKKFFENFQKNSISHMKCTSMKHRELLEFFTYLPQSLRYELLLLQKWKSDTLQMELPKMKKSLLLSYHHNLIYGIPRHFQDSNTIAQCNKMDWRPLRTFENLLTHFENLLRTFKGL